MKIKVDENLPAELVGLLTSSGHDVHTVFDEQLAGQNDPAIFRAAAGEDRLLITQDLDFSDVRRFKPGTHPGIVLIRLHQPSRRRIVQRFRQILASEKLDAWKGCFVVIGDAKLRIKSP